MNPFGRNLLPAVLLLLPVAACHPDSFEPPVPEEAIPAPTYASLSVGASHACALDGEGRAFCWGVNTWGQLGDGTTVSSAAPVPVAGGSRFKVIEPGPTMTCGITTRDDLLCWGTLGYVDERLLPTPYGPVGLKWSAVAAGHWIPLCALETGGRIFCNEYWGTPAFQDVSDGRSFAALSVGAAHACGITTSGAGFCWGRNDYRQLGTANNYGFVDVPVATPLDAEWAELVAGTHFTCGTTTAGATWCWGSAERGILALDSVSEDQVYRGVAEPVAIGEGDLAFSSLTPAATWSGSDSRAICGRLDIGRETVVCWGDGQPFIHIGFGLYDWRTIALGDAQAYGLTRDGRIFAWEPTWARERIISDYADWRPRLIYPDIEPVELPAPEREWRDDA